jgi:hypothetical protein
MRLSCPHYLDARVASGQSHVEVSENYDAVGLGSIRQPVPINLKGGGERRWPRCMPAKDKPRK